MSYPTRAEIEKYTFLIHCIRNQDGMYLCTESLTSDLIELGSGLCFFLQFASGIEVIHYS